MVMAVDIVKWKSALFSTFIISSVPNLLLYLIPNSWLKKNDKHGINVQHILLSFAAGGLLGDVILHIIPHLLVPHSHHSDEETGNVHSHNHGHDHDHDHDYERALNELHNLAVNGDVPAVNENSNHGHDHDAHDRALWVGLFILSGFLLFFIGEKVLSVHLAESNTRNKSKESSPSSSWLPETLSAMGWLNISADLMHNFTDGVAMGASCAASSLGGATGGGSALMAAATLSIFCHEVPHEIGDFAVLVESGMR
jgi:solute carrier family 39 (zinc transporter), member 7